MSAVLRERPTERFETNGARLRVLGNLHDQRRALAPWQEVGVVLVRAHQDHRLRLARRARSRRQVHAEDEAQLVDGRGRAASREHDHVGVLVRVPDARVARLRDQLARLLAEARGLQAARARGGVRVGVQRQDLIAHVVLDGDEGAPGGGPVRVEHGLPAEGAVERRVRADDIAPNLREPVVHLGAGDSCHGATTAAASRKRRFFAWATKYH